MDFLRQEVSIHGTSIAYTDEGSGPTILLLHGAPTTSYVYRHVITHLRHSFRCIAPDFPGWGDSTPLTDRKPTLPVLADVTTEFVKALDLEEVTMCVMDTAGAPGIRTVQHIPDRFSGLVIADTFVFPAREYPAVRGMLGLVTSRPFASANRRFNLLPRIVSRFGGRGRRLTFEERNAYHRAFPTQQHRDRVLVPLRDLRDNHQFLQTVASGLPGMQLPVLLLFGQHDPVRRVGVQRRLAETLPNATEVVIPGEAHFPHEGDPESVAGAILGWAANTEILDRAKAVEA
jgi:haloalkane dehalogenase